MVAKGVSICTTTSTPSPLLVVVFQRRTTKLNISYIIELLYFSTIAKIGVPSYFYLVVVFHFSCGLPIRFEISQLISD